MQSASVIRSGAACIILQAAILSPPCFAQLPFFSGAEGYGGTFTGTAPDAGWFSNATIYHVTNLNDSGPGSLRNAFVQNTANRIIVFDVAGTIQIGGVLDIRDVSNYYIAGQTAPGPVTVYGNMTRITHANDRINSNVILRYLTFRKGTAGADDAITFAGGSGPTQAVATNMILDHVSASWSTDEVLSVANNNTNVTVQYSIISDALTSDHAYGSLIRPRVDSNVTFHHNLYANNKSRNPRPGTYNNEELNLDFRNNVLYNWSDRAGYTGGAGETNSPTEFVNLNYVGNYLVAGPSTPAGAKSQTAYTKDTGGDPVSLKIYQLGNTIDSNHNNIRDGTDTGWGMFSVSGGGTFPVADRLATPIAAPAVTTQSASAAYDQVLVHVGNYWWSREAIDARIIGNVQNNTNPPNGVAANAPNASELNGVLNAPTITRPAGWDTDNDGMPDTWEAAHGLNPSSPAATPDWKLDFDSDGYVNLVEYLNEAGEFPAPAPIVFNGSANNRYAQITNWKTNDGGVTAGSTWQPSRFDEARINGDIVVVDAPGQHAGVLTVGALSGSPATLNITGGWLRVEEELVIAVPGAKGTVNLSGGVLSASELSTGQFGNFNFTGGTLHADVVNFDLSNNGGTLAPGHSIGNTLVVGDVTLGSGTLEIELESEDHADSLLVNGDALLGGELRVVPLAGFTPTNGDRWHIIAADGIAGQFQSITPGFFVEREGNNLMLLFGDAPPILAGDYNDDGAVDAADYVVWRSAMNSGTPFANETESLGTIDQADYAAWRANFGSAATVASSIAGGEVPEPGGIVLLLFSAIGIFIAPRQWSL